MISVNVEITEPEGEVGEVVIGFLAEEGHEVQVVFPNDGHANVEELQSLLGTAHAALPEILGQLEADSE